MMKSQSAMEYLMTYGWAILIIAVVLAVLFQLGVFSSGNFQPHAQAGSCQVSSTAAGISLEGQCNGLLPQYVAHFNTGAIQVASTSINTILPSGTNPVSMFLWVNSPTVPAYGTWARVVSYAPNGIVCGSDQIGIDFGGASIGSVPGSVCFDSCGDYACESNVPITANTWDFVGFVLNSGHTSVTVYFNSGSYTYSGSGATWDIPGFATPQPSVLTIGSGATDSTPQIPGVSEADLQIYNTSLSPAEVQALYLEGIGGAPIRPQNLVGWWPLNGNANDYSGNGNNGQPTGVSITAAIEVYGD